MAFAFVLEVAGEVQLARSFSRFTNGISDFSPAFREIVADFHKVEAKQFASEGGYGSGGWKPLNPAYAEWKARNYPGRPLMVLSGLLRESLLGNSPYGIAEIQPLQMRVGTQVNYALPHHRGLASRNLPARRLIDLTEADKMRWMRLLQAYLVRQIKEQLSELMPGVKAGEAHVRSIWRE